MQDLEHKKIEYRDADTGDVRVPDRLFPVFLERRSIGQTRIRSAAAGARARRPHSVGFFGQPWYQVIDDQSDATFLPLMTTRGGEQIDVEYRRRFNDGTFW